MAKASKKRGKKKAAKGSKKKSKAKKSARKSVKRAPAKRKGAKRKPAKRKPAKRAPKPPAEPWPMIFVVLLAMAAVLIAAWHFNGPAEAATFGSLSLPGAEQAVLPFHALDECHPVGAWLASMTAPPTPILH